MKLVLDISGYFIKYLLMNFILRLNILSLKILQDFNSMVSQKFVEDLLRGFLVFNDRVLVVVSDLLQEEQRVYFIGILEYWLIFCFKVVRLFKKKLVFIYNDFWCLYYVLNEIILVWYKLLYSKLQQV